MERFFEIDILRGFAVIAMVIFHIFYLLYLTGQSETPFSKNSMLCLTRFAHITFIILFGVNLALSFQKNKESNKPNNEYYGKQIKRALLFFIIAGIVTLFTYLIFPNNYVIFGIFHFLASSILISNFFVENKTTTTIGLIIFTLIYNIKKTNQFNILNKCYDTPLFCFISGLGNTKYNTIDHFAFVPYFIFVLIGILLGHTYFDKGKRNIKLLENKDPNNVITNIIKKIGQNSITIYIVHWFIIYYLIKKPDHSKNISDLMGI